MIGRVLLFVLCLAATVRALDYDTLFYNYIEDTEIDNAGINQEWTTDRITYGGSTTINLIEKTTSQTKYFRGLFRFATAGLAQVPDTNKVIGAKLMVKTTAFSEPYKLKVYAIYNDRNWVEGSKTGVLGFEWGHEGASWISPAQPAYPDTATGTLPSRFDWRDSSITTVVKYQNSCGSCWAYADVGVIEAAHQKDIITYTITPNTEDGTGADRNAVPLLTPSPEVTATGRESRPLPVWLLTKIYNENITDDGGFIAVRDSGDVKISTTENGSNNPLCSLMVTTRSNSITYEDQVVVLSGTSTFYDTYINSTNPTTNYGGADSGRVNATSSYLIRFNDFKAALNAAIGAQNPPSDTLLFIQWAHMSLYCTKYANASFHLCRVLKQGWIEGEATWNVWKTGYEWGTAGCALPDQLDLSEQQFLACVPDVDCASGGNPSTGMIYFMEDSLLSESAFPYTNNDVPSCPSPAGAQTIVKWGWRIPGTSARICKQAIMVQPIVGILALPISGSSFSTYAYSATDKCYYNIGTDTLITHAVDIMGYMDTLTCDGDGTGAWIVKNSAGYTWGQDGFAYLSYSGMSDFATNLGANNPLAPLVLSLTANVDYWSTPGIIGGAEASLVYTTPTIAANGWQAIDIPAWVIRGMINGNLSRSILLQAEDGSSTRTLDFASTENATTADRPYLVLQSAPQSQVVTKVGNTSIGNTRIGQ